MSEIALTSGESKTRLFYSRIADNRYPHRITLHVPDGEREPEHVIDMTDAEALAFARQSSWVKALVEALEALEKRMWRSGAGTVGFKWCAICGRSDLDTGKIGHKSDCPFAALAAFEEGQ